MLSQSRASALALSVEPGVFQTRRKNASGPGFSPGPAPDPANLQLETSSTLEDNLDCQPLVTSACRPRCPVNLPNYITISRIFAVPLLMWILFSSRFAPGVHGERELLASAVFILASITD